MAKKRKNARPIPTPKKGPVWVRAFLANFRETGNARAACAAAGIDRSTPYDHREKHPEFAKAWEDAKEDAADQLEEEARRRAYEGVDEPVFGSGGTGVGTVEVGTVRKYSDTLLIFLLKGVRPAKFRENVKHEHTGRDGGPIQYADASDDELDAEIVRLQAI